MHHVKVFPKAADSENDEAKVSERALTDVSSVAAAVSS